MNESNNQLGIFLIVLLVCVSILAAQEVPDEVRALAGTYTGSWSMFGLDQDGTIVKKMSWTDVSFAKHVLFKVITREDEVETHRISRVTTVHWTGKDNKEQWIQFISLQGIHKRQQSHISL